MKYKLTGETKCIKVDGNDVTVHRIQALHDFGDVQEGDLGGWVDSEERLSDLGDCWIYVDACACGKSVILDDACIKNNAVVCGTALVRDRAIVCDNAVVSGDSIIRDYSIIRDCAKVSGKACIEGHSSIEDNAEVSDCVHVMDSRVLGDAKICDRAKIMLGVTVDDNAIVCKDASVTGTATIAGDAYVDGAGQVLTIAGIGTAGRSFTFFRDKEGNILFSDEVWVRSMEEVAERPDKMCNDWKLREVCESVLGLVRLYMAQNTKELLGSMETFSP